MLTIEKIDQACKLAELTNGLCGVTLKAEELRFVLAALEAAEARAAFQEAKCNAAYEAVAEQAARADIAEARAGRLEPWLNAVLNQVDYTRNYCKPTEMVGAV